MAEQKSYELSVKLYELVNDGKVTITASSKEEAAQKGQILAESDYQGDGYLAVVLSVEELDDVYEETIDWDA